jgi:hypothetical protein
VIGNEGVKIGKEDEHTCSIRINTLLQSLMPRKQLVVVNVFTDTAVLSLYVLQNSLSQTDCER